MATTFSVSPVVREILERATVGPGSVKLPEGQLDRKLYLEVNKVLEAAGGKWNRKLGAHVFERDPREALGLAVETGRATNVKQVLQAFYTPDALADEVVAAAGIAEGDHVLEPSVGGGAFARAVFRLRPTATLLGIDIDEVAIRRLSDEHSHYPKARFIVADFLRQTRPIAGGYRGYDRVVMNPPFARGAWLAHVSHALDFLEPGGILAAIVPAGLAVGRTRGHLELRQKLATFSEEGRPLPDGSFKSSGTDVRVDLLIARAPMRRGARLVPKGGR